MEFLIDSAKLEEVRETMEMPFVNGVTTNTREVSYHSGDVWTLRVEKFDCYHRRENE